MRCSFVCLALVLSSSLVHHALAAGPFADAVVSYVPGANAASGYTTPDVVLGSPERFTGEGAFPAAVTPFNGPWGSDEIVSIGRGGSLTVRFDEPVANDANNPFGIDLLIFSNAFFFDPDTFEPIATAVDADGGIVEVSADGVNWSLISGAMADGPFPSLGYSDLTDPYATAPGAVPTDFTKPVNPALDWSGMNMAQLVAAYDGSGGGIGIDIGATGLSQISFVRVSLAANAPGNLEIDAFSDVAAIPSPGAASMLILCTLLSRRKSRFETFPTVRATHRR